MNAAISPLQAAAEVIRQLRIQGKRAPTNLEIQKLLYFCHGWSWALLGRPLVNEEFQAWQFGPVLPSVYHKFKVFSSNPIPADHPIFTTIGQLPPHSQESKLIERVLQVYGGYRGYDLVNLSHAADGPWAEVWSNHSSDVIPESKIQKYFLRLAGNQPA